MKIAIDISPIVYGTGVSVYTKNLVTNLLDVDKENSYLLFGGSLRRQSEISDFLSTLGKTPFSGKILPIPPTLADILWNKFHTPPIEQFIGKVDVFHSSDWTQPPSRAFKVTTIHDLVPLKFPDISDPKIVSAHKTRLKWVVKEVDRVIVPSQTTANDVEAFGVKRENIRIIPEAAGSMFKPVDNEDIKNMRRKYRISGKYLLAIGVNPRKNISRIIEAYEMVKSELGLKLVVVGHPYIDLAPTRGVVFTGYVANLDLPSIYSGAEALVYPSLYEGFGLPILEAFTLGLPVVTSNLGSMSEVAGTAAVLVDPFDIKSISDGIFTAIKNKKTLIKSALARSNDFSWTKVAKETLSIYTEAGI